jgi:hypothetical protein
VEISGAVQTMMRLQGGEDMAVAGEQLVADLGLDSRQAFVDVDRQTKFFPQIVHFFFHAANLPMQIFFYTANLPMQIFSLPLHLFSEMPYVFLDALDLLIEPLAVPIDLLIEPSKLNVHRGQLRLDLVQLRHDQFLNDSFHVNRHDNLLVAQAYHVARTLSRQWVFRLTTASTTAAITSDATAGNLNVTTITNVTSGWAVDEPAIVEVRRVAADAGDDLPADAKLVQIKLEWTASAESD